MGIFHRPLLSDLPATKIKYQAGDRVLVRVSCSLTEDQYKKIERAVRKHMGADVRILIVDCSCMSILWYQGILRSISSLVSKEDIELKSIDMGVANLGCSVVELKPGDRLQAHVPRLVSDQHRQSLVKWIQRWAGQDVEVVVLDTPL